MFHPRLLHELLIERGFTFFTGVPDSLLKDFCAHVTEHCSPDEHVIAANEGGAIALATGHYLATGRPALVYMQNSGLGNAVNPLTSLADPGVLGIPMLLVIGWRGEPGKHDEPQHMLQGRITPVLLERMEIPFEILPGEADAALSRVREVLDALRNQARPRALLVPAGTFEASSGKKPLAPVRKDLDLARVDAIRAILGRVDARAPVVSTTGMISREVFSVLKEANQEVHPLMMVGSMGHASSIALGVARGCRDRTVWCLDGDGAVIMHMGALAIAGRSGARNLRHIVLNNGVHDSVGGQPTVAMDIDLPAIARACGYTWCGRVSDAGALGGALDELRAGAFTGPTFLEVRVRPGSPAGLGRPDRPPVENRDCFMERVKR